MDDNAFFIRVWYTIAMGITVIAVAMTVHYLSQTMAIKQMVLQGVDPIRAQCAYAGPMNPQCAIQSTIRESGRGVEGYEYSQR